jgi:PAS domain S-box-containing protein
MENASDWEKLRLKVLGLGDSSVRKTHYPSLRRRLVELEHLRSKLQQSEAYLSAAQRMSHTGSFGWKPDTGEIIWSAESYRIFEYDRAVGPTIDLVAQRVHPEDRAVFQSAIERAFEGAPDFEHTYRLLLPGGRVKHVHALAHALQDASGNREFVGAVTDITERKTAEEALRASEAYLAEAQRLSHTGSWAWSPDTDVRYWSAECYRVLGFDSRDGLPRMEELIQRIHPDDQPGFRKLIETAIGEKAEWEADYRIVHPDGSVRDIHSIGHTVLSASGDLVEFVGTVIDVTERKRAAEALREAQGALARANRATTLGMLGASIAHEVNQPLGAIATSAAACSRWLSAQPPDLDKARRSLERIANDRRRASTVIDRLRALAKRQVPRKGRFDLNEVILEVLALTHDELRRNEILVETSLDVGLPTVECDRIQIQQIILNLIINAVEAMSALDDRRRQLAVGSAKEGANAVRVEVRDSGPGVDPSHADRLFEAFYTTKAEGMGMGLCICRAIIEAHGGRLWVSQNGPHGAAFFFSLPMESAAA